MIRVVLAVLTASAVVACTGGQTARPRSQEQPLPERSDRTVTVAGVTVTVPGLARAAELQVDRVAVPSVELPAAVAPAGQAVRVDVTGGAVGAPATVTFPTPPGANGRTIIPIVVWEDSAGGWRWLPTAWSPGDPTIIATTDHFSIGFAASVDVRRWAADRKGDLARYLSGRRGVAQPRCGDEQAARTDGIKVVSDAGDSVKWCFGVQDGRRLLKIANNRRAHTEITYPSTWKVVNGTSLSLSPSTITRVVSGKAAGALIPKGRTVRIVDGGDTLTLAVPAGQTGRVLAEMSVWAYYMSILQFGVETYAMVAKTAHAALGTAATGGWKRIAQRLAGTVSMDGYTEALRACMKGVAELTDSEPRDVGPALLKLGWGCIPALMQADVAETGVKMFMLGAVLAAIGAVVSFVLTAAHLLVVGVRQLWDDLVSFGGRSDPSYDIVILREQPAVLPPLPRTAASAAALDAFLHRPITGFEPIEGQPGEYDGCTGVSVAGADLDRRSADLYVSLTEGGDCGGDAAGTFYKIRDGKVVGSGFVCGDCDPDQFDRADFDRLVDPYGDALRLGDPDRPGPVLDLGDGEPRADVDAAVGAGTGHRGVGVAVGARPQADVVLGLLPCQF